MRTTADMRRLWGPACEFERRSLTLYTGATLQGLNVSVVEAFQALDGVMKTFQYVPRANSPGAWETGAYNCRKITNGKGFSLHAYGIAADINARTNPFGKSLVTDMPMAMINAVKGIETTQGLRVFRWGGDYPKYKDAMHYEVMLSRQELAAGIDWKTVEAVPPDPKEPTSWPTVKKGDAGAAVAKLHGLLVAAGFTVSSNSFGDETLAAVKAYQTSRKLTIDGIVGLQTWTALLRDLPVLTEEDPSPFKVDLIPRPERKIIKFGAKGPVVEELQRHLADSGFDPGPLDGVLGKKTKTALIAFQKECGLEPDAVCGPLTWRALLA
jgi:peptidoglycan hydrolase-like protein with peptidoglycan-binding domain